MTEPAKILVVDDDPLLLELLADTLQAIGYQTSSAENGHQALDRLREQRFDLVITDIKMPEMDGLNLLKKVRHRYPELPVLFITGVASPEIIGMAKPDGLLAKPFRISHVEELIESALRHKPSLNKRSTSRVLIVDEDESAREAISDSLSVSRYLPFGVSDDAAAFKEIEHGRIDAVLAAVDPSLNTGSELLAGIRRRKPEIPLIVLGPERSGGSSKDSGDSPQIDGYFAKPVAIKEIITLLDQLIPAPN